MLEDRARGRYIAILPPPPSQFLADQLTLFQPGGGALCACTNVCVEVEFYYQPPRFWGKWLKIIPTDK